MLSPSFPQRSDFDFRVRAQECRTLAESFKDDGARRLMLRVAARYDTMARNIEQLEAKQPEPALV